MKKTGAPGTLQMGLTEQGHVLLTILAGDGTETAMAITYPHFQNLAEKVKAQWVERRRRFVAGESDVL